MRRKNHEPSTNNTPAVQWPPPRCGAQTMFYTVYSVSGLRRRGTAGCSNPILWFLGVRVNEAYHRYWVALQFIAVWPSCTAVKLDPFSLLVNSKLWHDTLPTVATRHTHSFVVCQFSNPGNSLKRSLKPLLGRLSLLCLLAPIQKRT